MSITPSDKEQLTQDQIEERWMGPDGHTNLNKWIVLQERKQIKKKKNLLNTGTCGITEKETVSTDFF